MNRIQSLPIEIISLNKNILTVCDPLLVVELTEFDLDLCSCVLFALDVKIVCFDYLL
jgi:hypothetical protein